MLQGHGQLRDGKTLTTTIGDAELLTLRHIDRFNDRAYSLHFIISARGSNQNGQDHHKSHVSTEAESSAYEKASAESATHGWEGWSQEDLDFLQSGWPATG